MRVLRLAILLALLAVIGSAAFIGYRIFLGNSSAPLPSFKGASIVEAVASLERLGLQAQIDKQESTLPVGTVISQFPETGAKIRKDKPVLLRVSQGTAQAPLTDLRGLTEESAAEQLQIQGFMVGDLVKVNAPETPGTIIAQSPAAPASVPRSQKVDLMVSLGPTAASGKAVVPDLLEKNVDEARTLLSASGLRAGVVMEYTTASPSGMVISMSPRGGTTVNQNSEVRLTVATTDRRYAPQPEPQPAKPETEVAGGGISATGAQVIVVAPSEGTSPAEGGASGVTTSAGGTEKPAPAASGRSIAKIRYQVPPVKGMSLRIEMTDKKGVRNLLQRQAQPNEMISLDAPFTGEAVVTIFLGGEFVWQDRYK